MPDVEISYKGAQIASMSASGVKTLLTGDSFCEDDIIVSYTKPSAPTPTLQSKTVSPSTSQQTITPDSGYDGLSSVTVNAMPSGSATTPATTITANPTISVNASGLITASVSKTQGVTPSVTAGYVASGTSGTITVNGSNTNQLTTKSAQTYTPTTTDQTIASGQYLTGVQTIKGDANLLAENIKKDVVIFGITGTYEGGGSSNYTVAVSLTNPLNRSEFDGCYIFEALSNDPWDVGAQLDAIISAVGTKTIQLSSSVYGLNINAHGTSVSIPTSGISTTGGVTLKQVVGENVIVEVTGDGTITLDGIDYDD